MKCKSYNGIRIPEAMKIKSWIVTGTPGSGKTFLMEKIHGYPGEVCINIAIRKWWTVPHLANRPREIHLALPFIGHEESRPVYDEAWAKIKAKELPEVDLDRVRIPKKKKFFFSTNWHARFVFDFIFPPPKWTFKIRQNRLYKGDEKLVDVGISNKLVEWQVKTLWIVAWHFYLSGLHVLVRPFNLAQPYVFPELISHVRKQQKNGGGSVFPKGVDMGLSLTAVAWTKKSAPKKWHKIVLNKKNPRPKALN